MAALVCSKCGSEFEAPARFCRRCGNSLGPGEPSISPSEATTKSFDYPVEHTLAGENRTAPANQWPTTPAYLGPDQMAVAPRHPAMHGAETRGLANKKSKVPFVILGIVAFFLFIVVPAVSLLVYQAVYRNSSTAPVDSSIKGENQVQPPPPNLSGHPEIPPPPPGPPAPEGLNGTLPPALSSLIYPESKQSVNVHSHKEGTIILSTADSPSKVMDWYESKLPDADVVSIPFVGGGVITKGQVSVTITPGSPTTIILAMDKKGRE